MLSISDTQLKKLDIVAQTIFLKKVEDFITENLRNEISHLDNLKKAILEAYYLAEKKGIITEREIVNFIIENLPTK